MKVARTCACYFILCFLCPATSLFAQKLGKYYTSSIQENGILYYVNPQSGFINKQFRSHFKYDITYSIQDDSAIFNFSYLDNDIKEIDSVRLVISGQKFTFPAEKLFLMVKKKAWVHRYTSMIPFSLLLKFFDPDEQPLIELKLKNDSVVPFTIRSKTWEKNASITQKILTMIQYNK